ncbi:Kinesin-like protein kip2 [Friedmanniomyces endolithicus]|uniref:Kinesin-like protein KIP2 n=1 Tax=Friedmanniomyces endolithicus TaxID=329885 RepID=A0AAN6KBK2_9PEZI|nr:Kinesin-like protein kip2 [Friedmanniomyces endolithicus]
MTSTTTTRRPSTSPLAPPNGPLPALPVYKTRKALPERPAVGDSSSTTTTPKIPTRSVTTSGLPTPKASKSRSSPAVPTLNTIVATSAESPPSATLSSGLPAPSTTLRKTTSIGGFPLPPKGNPSLPPSPLSTSTSLSDINGSFAQGKRRDSSKHRSAESFKRPKARSSGYGMRTRLSASAASGVSGSPSLLNGTGDSNLVSSSTGSDSLLTLPSPPQSRSSSPNGSYMTDATTFEDVGEELPDRGRPKSSETMTDSRRGSGITKDNKGNVLVSVRVRPDASGGESKGAEGEWMVDGRRSLISYNGKEGGDYRYDSVFSPHDNNSRVYDNAAKRLVRRVMEGYHGTVFAYGMTGTGKTFSMQGTATSPGVIPLAITDIFSYIRENPAREFLLRVSYLEIYNEKIYDLLTQSTPGLQQPQEEIKLREDGKRGVYATPLKEEIVQSPNQLLRVISRGDLARRTSSTQYNARSSRSHAVVQIVVESRERTSSHGVYFEKEDRKADRILPGGVLVSTLSLIDLAGSEKAAENKERRTEGAHINKSLLTLGTVIGRLAGEDEKDKEESGKGVGEKERSTKHLPYRDSKLTRLLQPALSGDSLVSILCTIQLSSAGTSAAVTSSHTGETLNTLKFASRAKNNIVSHAKRNESNPNGSDPGSRALLDRYRIEIQDLRAQLEQQTKVKEAAEQTEELEKDRALEEKLEREERTRHEEQMLEMQLARTALKERISHLNRLILSSKSLGVNTGRLSSASIPLGRTSVYSNDGFGRPVSVRSRDSMRSTSHRDSAATLEVPLPSETTTLGRALSSGSITMGVLPVAQKSHIISSEDPPAEADEEDDSDNIDPDGNATLTQQNRMLQTDLADKNRYIATLEKRLLQARRTSRSRVSMHLSPSGLNTPDENGWETALLEKEREIESLRVKLDDQTRMVTALRSAARKRDMLDSRKRLVGEDVVAARAAERPATANAAMVSEDGGGAVARVNSRTSTRSTRPAYASHHSNPSVASRASTGPVNFSKTPLSPMAILSPGVSRNSFDLSSPAASSAGEANKDVGAGVVGARPGVVSRRKSVDEMTLLLDQMIQEKVESGHVVRGERGSLRVKRDTVMERSGEDAGAGAKEGEGEEGGVRFQVGERES